MRTDIKMRTDINKCSNIDRAIHFIDSNCMMPLSLDQVARESGMSKFYFSRSFKSFTGRTFKNYQNHKRIEKAKNLLQEPEIRVIDVCFLIGFNDVSYFNRVFKKNAGISPSCFKKNKASLGTGTKKN